MSNLKVRHNVQLVGVRTRKANNGQNYYELAFLEEKNPYWQGQGCIVQNVSQEYYNRLVEYGKLGNLKIGAKYVIWTKWNQDLKQTYISSIFNPDK